MAGFNIQAGTAMSAFTESFQRRRTQHLQTLSEKYGSLLTLAEIAEVLRYPSTQAAQKAHLRGQMPLQLTQFPPRRGWFATASQLADLLARVDDQMDSISGGKL